MTDGMSAACNTAQRSEGAPNLNPHQRPIFKVMNTKVLCEQLRVSLWIKAPALGSGIMLLSIYGSSL